MERSPAHRSELGDAHLDYRTIVEARPSDHLKQMEDSCAHVAADAAKGHLENSWDLEGPNQLNGHCTT